MANSASGVELEPGQDPLHLLVQLPAAALLQRLLQDLQPRQQRVAPFRVPDGASPGDTRPADRPLAHSRGDHVEDRAGQPLRDLLGNQRHLQPLLAEDFAPSGVSSPLISFSRVDLPVPLRPIRQSRSPGSSCRLMPSSSGGPPKATLTLRKLINAT